MAVPALGVPRGAVVKRALVLVLAAVAMCALAPTPASALPSDFVGLQGQNDPGAGGFDRIERANVRVWRTSVSWAKVEGRRGRYDWDYYDKLFARTAARNVRIFPVLIASPRWVSNDPKDPPRTDAQKLAYVRYAKAAVRRYGPNGTFWRGKPWPESVRPRNWQVWNEPNMLNFSNGSPNPRAYGRLLRATSQAIREADSDIRVVAAALYQWNTCPDYPCIDAYLREMFEVPGVGAAIDAVAVNAYTEDYRGLLRRLDLARGQVIRSLGKPKPMYITEFGWSTSNAHDIGTSPAGQAYHLNRAYTELLRRREHYQLEGAFWFALKDFAHSNTWLSHVGLFGAGWDPKPAWKALAKFTGGRP